MAALTPASNTRTAPSLPPETTEELNCKRMAQAIVKVALYILVPLAAAFLLHLALPSSLALIRGIVIPTVATTTFFALAFFFHVEQAEPVLPLSATAPCGLTNMGGNDCWLNSLAQLIRIDQGMRKWFTEVPRNLAEHATFLEYFSQDLLENLPEQLPEEVYRKLIEKGLEDIPANRQKLDEYAVRIRRLNPGQKRRLFRYLRFLRQFPFVETPESTRTVQAVVHCLLAFKKFMQTYDAYDAGVRRAPGAPLRVIPVRPAQPPARPQPPALFNSHELRLAVCRISNGLLDERSQLDPTEGLTMGVSYLLPDELTVQLQIRQYYALPRNQETGEMQPISDVQDNAELRDGRIIVIHESSMGQISCPMVGNFPNIKQSLESAFEEWNHNPANRITRTINGIEYEFPRIKDESQFLTAPKSLWLPPKRYRRVEPQWAGLHRMMPNWFDAQPADQIKDERPMTFQEILTIQPVQGGPARYKLDGFICHLGQTPDSGHYISYRLGKDDEGREAWFEMNDSVVTRISDAQMRAVLPTAYIPHYSRIED